MEPDSLPYGGTHRGADGYIALMQRIGDLFELRFDLGRLDVVDDETVVLRMDVTFTARATRRSIALPVVELLTVRAGRIARSEVFLKDTAALPANGLPRALRAASGTGRAGCAEGRRVRQLGRFATTPMDGRLDRNPPARGARPRSGGRCGGRRLGDRALDAAGVSVDGAGELIRGVAGAVVG